MCVFVCLFAMHAKTTPPTAAKLATRVEGDPRMISEASVLGVRGCGCEKCEVLSVASTSYNSRQGGRVIMAVGTCEEGDPRMVSGALVFRFT